MFRLFKGAGAWHRSAHLDESKFSRIEFAKNWENLVKAYNLRQYYIDIAPPFSKYAAPRVAEMENMDDDLIYYHAKRSIYRLIAWTIFITFILDWEIFKYPHKHWRDDESNMEDVEMSREGYDKEAK